MKKIVEADLDTTSVFLVFPEVELYNHSFPHCLPFSLFLHWCILNIDQNQKSSSCKSAMHWCSVQIRCLFTSGNLLYLWSNEESFINKYIYIYKETSSYIILWVVLFWYLYWTTLTVISHNLICKQFCVIGYVVYRYNR